MSYRIGNGYFGSDNKKTTSQANTEIIQQHKSTPTDKYFSAYKFTFKTFNDCHVKINGGSSIFLEANQVFSTDYYDAKIKTFVIVEAGVQYYYIGAY